MNLNEDAAMAYEPDDEPTGTSRVQSALAQAETQLTHNKRVKGMGLTKTSSGQDAIVVYVENEETRSQLPADVDGVPVIGEITGEIRAY